MKLYVLVLLNLTFLVINCIRSHKTTIYLTKNKVELYNTRNPLYQSKALFEEILKISYVLISLHRIALVSVYCYTVEIMDFIYQ